VQPAPCDFFGHAADDREFVRVQFCREKAGFVVNRAATLPAAELVTMMVHSGGSPFDACH
jgi:hypothetical protein